VVCAPYYYRGSSEEELHEHFATIADAATRPIVLYDLPQVTGYPMSAGLVLRLAAHPNIVGLKDSSPDWAKFEEVLAVRPPGFAMLHGDQERCADTMLLGAEGLVPGYANVWPGIFREVVDTATAGDVEGARRAQAAIDRLLAVRGRATSHANKVLAAELGLMQDHMTLPLPRLSPEEKRAVVTASRGAGLPLPSVR
jgi:4-hydroxy-tetrahydrodipicolinate synthase